MFKKIIIILSTTIILFISSIAYAEETTEEINYKKNIEIGNNFIVDISEIKINLEEKFNDKIFVEWNIKGESTKFGDTFEKQFEKIGDKKINLSIYRKAGQEKNLIINKDIDIFIFKKSHLIIADTSIKNEDINNLISSAKKSGVYIQINKIQENELNQISILEKIKKYNTTTKNPSNYISLWGEKDFLLSVLSKLNKEVELSMYNGKINFVLISSFNIDVLKNLLNNFLSNKAWIKDILMINEASRFQIIKVPGNITTLKEELISDKFNFVELNSNNKINNLLFISQFINNLSSKGFGTNDIYILLIIPFLFTLISIFKHLIGLSPIGIIIPIFIIILFFKVGLLTSFILLIIIVITNLLLSKITNKYTLLYTPKISFISIINILVMIISINLLYQYKLLNISITDSLFVILLIVIAERLLTIILGKEFSEYQSSLLNTLIFCLFGYFILDISIIKTFFLAYPEIILLLIPLNFIIGRFTGLRITEYFRFKEVIKNIEEE